MTHCGFSSSLLAVLAAVALGSTLRSQQARLDLTPAATQPGQAFSYGLQAAAQSGYALWFDAKPAAGTVAGQGLRIALSPGAFALAVGSTDGQGAARGSIMVPNLAALLGTSAYAQGFVLDPSSSNGVFRSTDGESLTFYRARSVHVERFDDPKRDGFVGEFVATGDGRLLGLAPTKRSVVTVDKTKSQRYALPVVGELSPYGGHQQVVLRASDLGAQGDEEIVTAIRMRPLGAVPAGLITKIAIDLAHSAVVPDFRLDSFTALPRFPNSGLSFAYAQNILAGTKPVRVYSGPWAIRSSSVTASGYLPYPPVARLFRYNGTDSLLVDVRVAPTSTFNGQLGHQVWLPIPSSPRPYARLASTGLLSAPFDPFTNPAQIAQTTDNSQFEFEVDLVDATSVVVSPWRDSGAATPKYGQPILAAELPASTDIVVELRDAKDAMGNGASAWTRDAKTLTGQRFFQQRITLRGRADGVRPWLEALVIPID